MKNLKLIGFNSAGLASKLFSFDHILSTLQPAVFFVQETKMRKQGKIRTKVAEKYQIFELVRIERQGGGLAIGAVKDLEPIWIAEGDDEVEILVIEIKVEDLNLAIAPSTTTFTISALKTRIFTILLYIMIVQLLALYVASKTGNTQ